MGRGGAVPGTGGQEESEAAGRPNTMGDLLVRLPSVDDELTVFVEPDASLSVASRIRLLDEETDTVPDRLDHLLEVRLIKEVVEVWRSWRGGSEPTGDEACSAVAHYVRYDSFQPVPDRHDDDARAGGGPIG